ncbi:MAG TPA: SUMF1/EgtB/PvdO family nonheme iron enzyme [Sedimentisphaerales bacterium]|nr:SUMF1/EgtB/PvdO family nonheme iron enzyme [Sedimentisphaerales bacterium]
MEERVVKNWTFSVALLLAVAAAQAADTPTGKEYTNFMGMKFVRIEPGVFQMGQLKIPLPYEILPHTGGRGDRMDCLIYGDFDEKPTHEVRITKPFYAGVSEVTNFQYELFDPERAKLRGKNGFSKEDNEAVVYVNWYDAQAFCQWLSDKEGLPYRLPTEAEWEYACRAGTATNYYAADVLPKEFTTRGRSLEVGRTPPNAWGLYDMHGNVEEWCHDWYGPYRAGLQADPVGYVEGDFRVTRSGHDGPYIMRSANRMGALPQTRNWVTGLRVVIGEPPETKPLPAPPPPLNQQNVVARCPTEAARGPDPKKPYFKGPRKYVKIPRECNGPLFAAHNHDPAIVECPNGDLLTVWYTCDSERNWELAQAASRLRWGADEWEPASPFWDGPDRNDHAPALWFDGKNTIYHFTGLSYGDEHREMALVMRTSTDSGASWSRARMILPEFERGHMPSEPVFRMNDGRIVLTVDGPDTLWMSADEGLTWTNPGGDIPGIHAGVTQLEDGRILAYSRGGEINGMMAKSISSDGGKTFVSVASEFPHVDGGQRLVLLRLREGSLFFASFADKGIMITDSTGRQREGRGLFGAVSLDGGQTWPYKRLITDDGPGRPVECTNGGLFIMSGSNAEHQGYMAVCQGLDGVVHLISSFEHYAFNLKWLMTPPPSLSYPPVQVKSVVETFTGPQFDAEGWVEYKGYTGGFNGKGQYTVNSLGRSNGINRIAGKGSFEAAFAVKNLSYNPGNGGKSPGPRILFRDARTRSLSFRFDRDHIALEIKDEQTSSPLKFDRQNQVRYSTPPTSAKARLTWNENTRQWRIFYGLNGQEPTIEMPQSKAGIYFGKPLSETTAVYLVVDHGSADFDYFEIKPIEPGRYFAGSFDAKRKTKPEKQE